MSNCSECGAKCEPEDRYCPQCGRRMSGSTGGGSVDTQKSLDLSEIQYNLGMVYFKKQEYQRAIETWEKVLGRRPDDGELKRLIEEARSQADLSGGVS